MFNQSVGIGLDIGSKKIKLVQLNRTKKYSGIKKFGSMDTPPGTVEAGCITNPDLLGEAMAALVNELKLKGKKVVSAVSGQQVYVRKLVMPRMKLKELKEATMYQATTFLPIPVEDAVMDICPLREFEDEDGPKTEVFFAAVRRMQVENLQTACSIAGLKLVAVELEPLAIYRILGKSDAASLQVFLDMGASHSYFSVFKNGVLVFQRYLTVGCSAFLSLDGKKNDILDNINLDKDSRFDNLINDIVALVARSVEYYSIQNKETLDKIWLCGGGTRIKGIDSRLATELNCKIQIPDTFAYFKKPATITETGQKELQHDFLVALGLAAREVR